MELLLSPPREGSEEALLRHSVGSLDHHHRPEVVVLQQAVVAVVPSYSFFCLLASLSEPLAVGFPRHGVEYGSKDDGLSLSQLQVTVCEGLETDAMS